MKRGRTKPYTDIGIRRMPCSRSCGRKSRCQWQICADKRLFRTLCAECDVELNAMVMRWVWGDTREADIQAYRDKVFS